MSGYNLAGGKHPGQDLADARKKWFRKHLAAQHRAGGSVLQAQGGVASHTQDLASAGDGGLRAKRAEITKELLQLASAPTKRRSSHGGELQRLDVKARKFGQDAIALAQRQGTSLAGDGRKSGGVGGTGETEGGEAQRLNALVEKEVLDKGGDAYSSENASLRRAIQERGGGREGEQRLLDVPRTSGGKSTAKSPYTAAMTGSVFQHFRPGGDGNEWRATRGERLQEQERARERQAREAAKRVWSDSLHTRAAAGFLRASKASHKSPYTAAMTGSVFQHFLRHPSPRMLTQRSIVGVGEAATHASEAAMVARAGVRTHNVEGREVPSGYTGFAGF